MRRHPVETTFRNHKGCVTKRRPRFRRPRAAPAARACVAACGKIRSLPTIRSGTNRPTRSHAAALGRTRTATWTAHGAARSGLAAERNVAAVADRYEYSSRSRCTRCSVRLRRLPSAAATMCSRRRSSSAPSRRARRCSPPRQHGKPRWSERRRAVLGLSSGPARPMLPAARVHGRAAEDSLRARARAHPAEPVEARRPPL